MKIKFNIKKKQGFPKQQGPMSLKCQSKSQSGNTELD
jgi:hypothetical protein